MPTRLRRRAVLVASGSLLGIAALGGAFLLLRGQAAPATLPDFANQKVVYEPAIGAHYRFSGVDALLLTPDDLGADWYFGSDPAVRPVSTAHSSRRLVKASRAPGAPWKADTCVMEAVSRWGTPTAAAAELGRLVGQLDVRPVRRLAVDGVPVTLLDTPQLRSAVFQRGTDVFNLNVCLHLATSDFSPAAADAVVEAAVHRSAG